MSADFVALKRILVRTTSPGFRRGLIATRDKMLDYHARWRSSTGWSGRLPDFIVVGTQKGGTTELYDQLAKHPQVAPAFAKEVHYFDANYSKGLEWYTAFFPPHSRENSGANSNGADTGKLGSITGEASPCYLFHPDAARRAAKTVPNARIILLLRNPVERAYSHYHHEVRLGYETYPFETAIEHEQTRLSGEKAKLLREQDYYSDSYMHYSYLSRGVYLNQVQAWYEHFPQEQILVLKSEEFYAKTPRVMSQVFIFLGLEEMQIAKMQRHKSFPYPKMEQDLRRRLAEYFVPHNQALYDYLGRDFCWS